MKALSLTSSPCHLFTPLQSLALSTALHCAVARSSSSARLLSSLGCSFILHGDFNRYTDDASNTFSPSSLILQTCIFLAHKRSSNMVTSGNFTASIYKISTLLTSWTTFSIPVIFPISFYLLKWKYALLITLWYLVTIHNAPSPQPFTS